MHLPKNLDENDEEKVVERNPRATRVWFLCVLACVTHPCTEAARVGLGRLHCHSRISF